MSKAPVYGLIVTHGRLGEALIEVVEHLLGPQQRLSAISNDGLTGDALRARVASVVDALDSDEAILLFTDLSGGSCDTACRVTTRAHAKCTSVTGVNLPMLLEFCHYRERLSPEALLERIVAKARAGVSVLDHTSGRVS